MKNFDLVRISLLIALSASLFSACDRPPPAGSAGQKLDQTAAQAGRKIGEVVERVDSKIDEQAAKAAAGLEDLETTTRVKAAIFAEPGLKTLQIGVATERGVVTLSGSVDTPADRELVRTLAGSVAGVKSVKDQLAIKPPRTAGAQ